MRLVVVVVALIASSAFAQYTPAGPVFPVGSGGSTPTLVNQFSAGFGSSGGTTGTVDCTGANFILVCSTVNSVSSVTDSKGNVYTPLTAYTNGSTVGARIYYMQNPIVGSMTWTIAGSSAYPSLSGVCLSGMATSSVFDSGTDSGFSSNSSVQAGSITVPAGHVALACVSSAATTDTLTISSPFSIATQGPSGAGSYVMGISYYVDASGSAVNPTWTNTSGAWLTAAIGSFKN